MRAFVARIVGLDDCVLHLMLSLGLSSFVGLLMKSQVTTLFA